MPHIELAPDMPGITAGFAFRPDTAAPMRKLAHILLHTSGNDGFSSRDREVVATFVSSRNSCHFCQTSHAASHLNDGNTALTDAVCQNYQTAPIPDKLKALMAIAEQVQIDGKRVSRQLVDTAREHGATDLDIHDTVLIAAAFCMYNRYVDGLATIQPPDGFFSTDQNDLTQPSSGASVAGMAGPSLPLPTTALAAGQYLGFLYEAPTGANFYKANAAIPAMAIHGGAGESEWEHIDPATGRRLPTFSQQRTRRGNCSAQGRRTTAQCR